VQITSRGQKKADGRIDPGGRTFGEIIAQTKPKGEVKVLSLWRSLFYVKTISRALFNAGFFL
jgi:hypothetical protein